jgi:F-type H+-transporting ATPase subunit delta
LNRSEPAARCYAEAVLFLAKEKGRLEEAMDDLRAVEGVFHADARLRGLFTSPRIDRGVKEEFVKRAFRGRVGDEILGLLVVLVRKSREALYDNVVDYFDRLKDVEQKRIHVHLSSARPLDAAVKTAIEEIVRDASGKTPVSHEKIDPALVGGLVVRVNDVVVDGSLRTRLRALRSRLVGDRR